MSDDAPGESAGDRLDAIREEELVEALLDAGALRFGEFELAHGGTSEYYVDKYRFETSPRCLDLIAEAFAARLGESKLAGVALGAVPLATATALAADREYVIVRKAAKEHGTGNRIEGELVEGERVVVLEDVATTGTSAAEAVGVLREAGATVDRVLVVVDRQEGAAAKLAGIDCELEALLTAEDLLSAADGA